MKFWVKRISHNAHALLELLWEEGEESNLLVIIKQNKEKLQLLRYKITRTIQTFFSFEAERTPFEKIRYTIISARGSKEMISREGECG